MYKNLYRGKVDFANVKEGSVYRIVEVNFSGRENMTKAYKAKVVEKTKKAGYESGPGVVVKYMEGPWEGKSVIHQAYKLHFFPEGHEWNHLKTKTTRRNRRSNRKTRRNRH